MLIYNDIFHYRGFGGKHGLASGTCRLRIFDQRKEESGGLVLLRPMIVIVSDVPGNDVSVSSCAGHIATMVTTEFAIKPQRMMWVEHFPAQEYGKNKVRTIPEKFDAVEFVWKENKAIEPKRRALKHPILDLVKGLMKSCLIIIPSDKYFF